MNRTTTLLLVGCLCVVLGVTAAGQTPAGPTIVDIYPNPVADGDSGEFVTMQVPAGTNLSAYKLADEQRSVRLSNPTNGTVDSPSTVTVSTSANRTRALVGHPVVSIPEELQLANGGERVRLLHDGTVVDEVTYGTAPEGERYDVESGSWEPVGVTERPVISQSGGTVEAFVLPDEPERAIEFLANASERILLSGYTVTSARVVETLIEAQEQGVDVQVLAEANPVGGLPEAGADAFDRLVEAGISVQVFSGEPSRYRYHHAKYAVADGKALVSTENWKPSGLGGQESRGWGVITAQRAIVDGLVETFRADADWVDTQNWTAAEDVTTTTDDGSTADYPSTFEASTLPVERTQLLLAPDNAEETLLQAINGARDSLDIKQVRIGDPNFPLLRATLRAAERGVRVRILLSGAWYAEAENRQMKRWLEEQAAAAELPLSVRIADPDGRFGKIHAKGVIVDGERTFVGSINWGNNSLRNNREVGLLLDGPDVGDYFTAVFESDWGKQGPDAPLGYVALCLIGALCALAVGHRIEFEN